MRILNTAAILNLLLLPSAAPRFLQRSIGDPDDPDVAVVAESCMREGFDFSRESCPALMDCVLNGLDQDVVADFSSGSNIASLVPTILALIGAGPMDLVQLSFVSPLRALVSCVFAIGLPQGLFRQFSKHSRMTKEGRTREWIIPVPPRRGRCESSWKWRTFKTVLIDLVILGLAAIMLWQNCLLGAQLMVTWSCRFGWLLSGWPIACAAWLAIAMILLVALTQKLRIRYSEDGPGATRSLADLLRLAYALPKPKYGHSEVGAASAAARGHKHEPSGEIRSVSEHEHECDEGAFYRVALTMKFESAWTYYEAVLEFLAVGIYLFSTFVLTSALFIHGKKAIVYMVVMVLCLSGIRILDSL